MREFDRVLGLGPNCKTKFQLNRIFGRERCNRSVFDAQATPVDSIIRYIEADFRGIFSITDLRIKEHEVRNVRFGTSHPHSFPRPAKGLHTLLAHYPYALTRHHMRREDTRRALHSPGRLLVVVSDVPANDLDRIREAIQRYSPALNFELVSVNDGHMPPTRDRWHRYEGNDEAWSAALRDVGLSSPSFARLPHPSLRA
jgi:hypothetical protein